MSCKNCFNGCNPTISDKCVKYTGQDIDVLNIENGDSLLSVQQSITSFLIGALNGTAIKPIIDEDILCSIVSSYLPNCTECNGFNINDIITALIKTACDLQEQVNNIVDRIDGIESEYTVDCISVNPTSGTHNVLQAVINKVCEIDQSLQELADNIEANYVTASNIDDYIQNYLNNQAGANLINKRMVPYSVVSYFGTLTNFDITGSGIGNWAKIYLCNGNNGTPDLRGRVLVGATTMSSNPFSPAVDPAITGNPTYALNTVYGTNQESLTEFQIPAHTHSATTSVTDPGHKHDILGIRGGDNSDNNNTVRFAGGDKNQGESNFYFTNTEACQNKVTGVNVSVSIGSTGGAQSHNNVQPSYASYYIMYIP